MSAVTTPSHAEGVPTRPGWFAQDAYREQRGEHLPDSQEEEEHTHLILSPLPKEDALVAGGVPTGTAVSVGGETSSPSTDNTHDLEAVRTLIMSLHPGIVPELIGGDSVTSLIASIAPAQEAYERIVATVRVPAGGNPVVAVDTEALSAIEKIQRGLSGGCGNRA